MLARTNYRSYPALMKEIFDDEFFNSLMKPVYRTNTPSVNILENDDQYTLELSVPGYKKDEIRIDIENEMMKISSDKETETHEEGDKYSRKEFNYASFSKSFTLPESVDINAIKAEHADGILKVILPKKEEAKPLPARKIEIA